MGWFSRSDAAAEPAESCPANCQKRYQDRQALMARVGDKARYQREQGTATADTSKAVAASARFNQYNEAMVRARAAENVYTPEKPGTCLNNLSNDPAKMNAALGLPPGTLTANDFRNDQTGFKASLYQSESNGKYILAYAGTSPHSLADWETNIDNGQGEDTKQYLAARNLASKLQDAGVDVDITGHSKGGGMATEAGLVDSSAQVWTFNSAGLNPASLGRTGASNFDDIASRTQAFHSQGDFLTMIQTQKDPATQISNAQYLRNAFDGNWYTYNPLKITDENNTSAPVNEQEKTGFLHQLDGLISNAQQKQAKGENFNLFPQAIGQSHEIGKSSADGPGLHSLYRHTMGSVIGDLEEGKTADQKTMNQYLGS